MTFCSYYYNIIIAVLNFLTLFCFSLTTAVCFGLSLQFLVDYVYTLHKSMASLFVAAMQHTGTDF